MKSKKLNNLINIMAKIVILQNPYFIMQHPLEPILRKVTQKHQKDPDVTKMSEDFKEEGVEFVIDTGKNSKDETITAFIFGGIPIIGIK